MEHREKEMEVLEVASVINGDLALKMSSNVTQLIFQRVSNGQNTNCNMNSGRAISGLTDAI